LWKQPRIIQVGPGVARRNLLSIVRSIVSNENFLQTFGKIQLSEGSKLKFRSVTYSGFQKRFFVRLKEIPMDDCNPSSWGGPIPLFGRRSPQILPARLREAVCAAIAKFNIPGDPYWL
jgi:hypothetical protein